MKYVDLNADLAEGFEFDSQLLQIISSANICCGLHAGGYDEIRKALVVAKQNKVTIGAHPSFPDRQNFGRLNMQLSTEQLSACLFYQLGAVQALCDAHDICMSYVKPHGALYNQANQDELLATTIVKTIKAFNPELKLMALSGSLLLNKGREAGLQVISEVFADRAYLPDGGLVPRSQANALLESNEAVIKQVLSMVLEGQVRAIDGSLIKIEADSICLHGDGEHAVEFAQLIRKNLQQNGVQIANS